VLSLKHERIPKNLHFNALNPRISLEGTPLVLATEVVPWPRGSTPRRAGVSSFGMSGTNAHVILEEAPAKEPTAPPMKRSAYLLPLSAKSPKALLAMAQSYAEWLAQNDDQPLCNVTYTASMRRNHFEHRLAVVAANNAELTAALQAVAAGDMPPSIVTAKVPAIPPKVVFIFPGQGTQWLGMGKQLFQDEPVYRDTLLTCDAAIRNEAGFSAIEELDKPVETSRLSEIDIIQPVLFAMQVALAALWQSWGVEPSAVVGHSMGEVAAAVVSGALSLEDASAIICRRSRLLRRMRGQGAMALVEMSVPEATDALLGYENRLSIAVSNGPRSTVIAGIPAALDDILAKLEKTGVFCQRIKVDVASHSPQMEALADEVIRVLSTVAPKQSRIPMFSTVTGERVLGDELSATYWSDNLRKPVLFSRVVQHLMTECQTIFLELSPHPVLLPFIDENLLEHKVQGAVLSSLRFGRDERQNMLLSLGALHVHGVSVAWNQIFPDGGRVVDLPTYSWQRERFWIDLPNLPTTNAVVLRAHPLLGVGAKQTLQPGLHTWQQSVSVEAFPYLADHRVQGEVVFPGACYVELTLAAAADIYGEKAVCIDEITFERILALPAGGTRIVQVSLLEEGDDRASITISSKQHGDSDWVRHAKGSVRTAIPSVVMPEARTDMNSRYPERMESTEHYARMTARAATYGKTFQGVKSIHLGDDGILARIELPDDIRPDAHDYSIHPALLDACVQAASWSLRSILEEGTFVPIKMVGIRVYERPGHAVWVHGTISKKAQSSLSLIARDEAGNALFEIDALQVQRLTEKNDLADKRFADCVFEVAWQRQDLSKPGTGYVRPSAETWLVLSDERGLGKAVVERLRARGQTCVEVIASDGYGRGGNYQYRVEPTNLEQWSKLLSSAFGTLPCCGIVHCASLDGSSWNETTEASLDANLRRGPLVALRIAQAVLQQGWQNTRLYVLTRGAQAFGSTSMPVSIGQSTLWGFGRALALEQPNLGCVQIDLSADPDSNEPELITSELLAASKEDQIALRHDGRYVARLVKSRLQDEASTSEQQEFAAGRPFRLEIHAPGVLDQLALRPMVRRSPGFGEVEIEVVSAGLNFVDVMKAMGVYPGIDRNLPPLGGECSGRILTIGEGVNDFHEGQAVIAVSPWSFSSHITVRADFVEPMPTDLSFEEAATIPAVFMTVYWALHHVGRLQPGERILIHSAAGGTGLAAIQYAQAIGAEIFATAGNDDKRAYLRAMGIEHVMDSRSLAFADEVLAKTDGQGVDVVLNSLTGDAALKSLDVLAPYGRFLELGKKDIYANARLGLLPFRKSLSYTSVDLGGMSEARPLLFSALLREVVTCFQQKFFQPLPVNLFSSNEADAAFRLMARAQHIGKIAITMTTPTTKITVPMKKPVKVGANATYMITGGLGGLGISLAQWFVEQGARSLALVSRSAPTTETKAFIDKWRMAGILVRIFQADVSQLGDLEAVVAEIDRTMAPLQGVVHAAGLLDDRTIPEMSAAQFLHPMEPKVFGAWNLHQVTQNRRLDFFVMYSSGSGLMGSAGQTNYAAANSFLDALCQARVAEGLPALSIQWGAFRDVGLVAASDIRRKRLLTNDKEGFKPAEGNELFGRVLSDRRSVIGLIRFDVAKWRESFPHVKKIPFFEQIVGDVGTNVTVETSLVESVRQTQPDERIVLIENHLLVRIGQVLHLDPSRIDRLATFSSIGMDSLMSLELRNRLEPDFNLKLSATLLFAHPTPAALASHVLDRLAFTDVSPTTNTKPEAPRKVDAVVELEPPIAASTTTSDVEAAIEARLAALSKYLD
jgi:acyl transferase domain-containing protein/NADPH:quinone reductase-like Zn-dependent oxidoreductase/acyl carrier protein